MKEIFIDALETNSQILDDFIGKMNSEEISKRINDFWTIYQHVEHLVVTQKVILNRLKQFIKEENPIMKP